MSAHNKKTSAKALGRQHAQAEQWYQQALARHRAGQLSEAERFYRECIRVAPAHADGLHMLGVALAQSGRPEEAAACTGRALEIQPRDANLLGNHASTLILLKRLDEALACLDRVLALQPGNVNAHYNRGDALRGLERFEDALAAFDAALALKPDFGRAHCCRAHALRRLGRHHEALAAAERAVALDPRAAESHHALGHVLFDLRRWDDALAAYGAALARRSEDVDALLGRGNTLRALRRFEEAISAYDRIVARQPGHGDALNARGVAQESLRRFDDAIASYQSASAANPTLASAHINEALCRLLTGDFVGGWQKYTWRHLAEHSRIAERDFAAPLWTGTEPLQGRRILLHAEQGLGDVIQFCRYARQVKARGAHVILEAWSPLLPLLHGLAGVDALVARGEPLPAFDLHCPLLDLPGAFGTALTTIPAELPYLHTDPARLTRWRERLGGHDGLRVGLVWSGNAKHSNDHHRSIPLQTLLPLARPGIRFYALQPEVRERDRAALAAFPDLLDLGPELADFADTAAALASLDLVLSVDTSVAHLAGALGRPLWLMLPHRPDWRWLLDRADSPWYPGARLFRQLDFDDWESVVKVLGAELAALAAHG